YKTEQMALDLISLIIQYGIMMLALCFIFFFSDCKEEESNEGDLVTAQEGLSLFFEDPPIYNDILLEKIEMTNTTCLLICEFGIHLGSLNDINVLTSETLPPTNWDISFFIDPCEYYRERCHENVIPYRRLHAQISPFTLYQNTREDRAISLHGQ
ncbi:hypothetical protein ACJX0J_020864, partial [Zea mays]